MAYSSKVVDRFEDVLKNPAKHGVGRFDPKDPNVVTGLAGAPLVGKTIPSLPKIEIFLLSDIPIIGNILFSIFVYAKNVNSAKYQKVLSLFSNALLKSSCHILAYILIIYNASSGRTYRGVRIIIINDLIILTH